MSNNYSEYRTTIFPSQDDRDAWVTQCKIARAASHDWLRKDNLEGFEPIGDRCLRIWHDGNVKTASVSKLLQINNQLADQRPELPWLGSHRIEGNEYCFDYGVNGKDLSFDEFPIMMAADDDASKFDCYKSWAVKICEAITVDRTDTPDDFLTKDWAGNNFLRKCENFASASGLLRYAKTDTQIESFHSIMVEIMRDIIRSYNLYEILPANQEKIEISPVKKEKTTYHEDALKKAFDEGIDF